MGKEKKKTIEEKINDLTYELRQSSEARKFMLDQMDKLHEDIRIIENMKGQLTILSSLVQKQEVRIKHLEAII